MPPSGPPQQSTTTTLGKDVFRICTHHIPADGSMRPCNGTINVTTVAHEPAAPGTRPERMPVVVWLHATGGSAAVMRPRLLAYASLGFLAVAIDCRYHGERADTPDADGVDAREMYQRAVFRCGVVAL